MAGIFAPTPDTNVYVRSPTEPVKPGPSDLEIGVGLAEGFLGGVQSFMKASQTTAKSKGSKVDPNLKIFSEEMDKIGQIRSSQGEMAGRLAERNVASNFAAAGIDLGAEYKTVYETKTGRSFDAYGRDDVAYLREQQLKDENIQASMVASLAILRPNASIEDRLNYAIGEKAKVQAAANLVARAQADATVNWLEAEAGFNQITDNFLATGMGGLIQREQSGIPITAQDIAQFKLNWNQLKAGPLSQPRYLKDDQWKAFGSRLTQVDNMIATLEKAASNETLSNSMTKHIADAISKADGYTETQKAVLTLGAMKGDPAILQQLIGPRFGDVAKILNNTKVADLPSTKIFGSALTNPNTPPPGPNHILTKDQIPSEIQNKYDMSASERVNQLRADKTWASLFTASNMANPENREAFAERAMSLGTTLVTGNTDEFLSANFLKDGIASPKFLNALKGLEEQDADLGMKTKTYVRSGLFTEKTRQNANLSSVENRIQGANFNEQTGKYEIDANFFRNKQDVAAFNADLNEFYGGDLSVAARDNFNKIEAKYSGFRVSGVNATNVIRLGRLNAIPEALKRREAIKVIDQGLEQLADPTEDILAPITEPSGEPIQEPVMNQGLPVSSVDQGPESGERGILQRIGEFFLGSPAAAAELPPDLRDLALSYARKDRPELVPDNPAYQKLIDAGVNPVELQGIILGESKGDPKAYNEKTKASGLFQFIPDAAKELGTTVEEIRRMTAEEQADLYLKYLNRWGWKPGVPLGLMQAAPSLAKDWNERSRDDVVYKQGSKEWVANPGWRSDPNGDITIGSIEEYYANETKLLENPSDFVAGLRWMRKTFRSSDYVPLPPRRPEEVSDEDFISQISKALTGTPTTERRVREAQARQAAKEAYYKSLNVESAEERSLGFSQGRLDSAIESATLAGVASTVLDFVPVVGEIKGGVELIEQYQEDKDPVMAGINLAALALGVIPGVGDAAGKALKGAAPKLVDEASKFVDEFLEGKLFIPEISKDRPPNKTVTAYKLMRVKKEDDNLYPLFVDSNTPFPQGEWIKAKIGKSTVEGKVDSSLGPLAIRPGAHAGDSPKSTHIGGKLKGESKPSWRPADQVWYEVEFPDNFDWQTIANSRASIIKSGPNKGKLNSREAQITDQVPYGGYYRYKTNPNMEGEWLISGDMKINRKLSPSEIKEAGDLPTLPELIEQRNLTVKDLPKSAVKELKDYYPETFQKMLMTE